MVAPGEFIPLAEEMGLIEAIGDWVSRVGRQAVRWRAGAPSSWTIGVQHVARQFWQPGLVEQSDATSGRAASTRT